MYYLFKDGDSRVIFTHVMCSSSAIMGKVIKSNSAAYKEGKGYSIYIHDNTEVYRYQTLEDLLAENFSEFV